MSPAIHATLDASLCVGEFSFCIAKLSCTAGKEYELTAQGIEKVVPTEDKIAAAKTEIMGSVKEMAADVIFLRSSVKSATGTDTYISTSTTMLATSVFMQ